MGTWEGILATVAFGLGNGGPGGLVWTFVASWAGFMLIGISMAEMVSPIFRRLFKVVLLPCDAVLTRPTG
jgi:amino acid transporter